MNYEYKITGLPTRGWLRPSLDPAEAERLFNELGANGWEWVGTLDPPTPTSFWTSAWRPGPPLVVLRRER